MKLFNRKYLVVLFIAFSLTGCYTVVWEPDMEFPNEYNSEISSDVYYVESYYGNYDYFYNYPWWLSITPPTKERVTDRDKNPSMNTLRNENGGRINTGNRNPDILVTPPPSRDGSSNNTGSDSGSNTGSNDRSVNTDNSSNTNRSNNSGNSQNPVRNNDGNRNTDGKRR